MLPSYAKWAVISVQEKEDPSSSEIIDSIKQNGWVPIEQLLDALHRRLLNGRMETVSERET